MIAATEPMIYQNPHGKTVMQVNTSFHNGSKLVSLTCDNSVGRLQDLSRSDIRCFIQNPADKSVVDVTSEVFRVGENDVVQATLSTMETAMKWLRLVRWGFVG